MNYWEENGIKKPQQIVVCAACMYEGIIVTGARHWDKVMRTQYDMSTRAAFWDQWNCVPAMGEYAQGFINQFGDFLTRKEAMQVVLANTQSLRTPREKLDPNGILFSEDLY